MTIVGLKELIARSTTVPEAEQRLMTSDHDILEDIWFDENNKVHQKRLKLYPQIGDESVVHLLRLTNKRLKLTVGPWPNYTINDLLFYCDVPKVIICSCLRDDPGTWVCLAETLNCVTVRICSSGCGMSILAATQTLKDKLLLYTWLSASLSYFDIDSYG